MDDDLELVAIHWPQLLNAEFTGICHHTQLRKLVWGLFQILKKLNVLKKNASARGEFGSVKLCLVQGFPTLTIMSSTIVRGPWCTLSSSAVSQITLEYTKQ